MSKPPFSKPNVNYVVTSSHAYKIRSSLNHWSRGRLPKSRAKHLFGIVVALLLLGLPLTACGNAASPTSNSTSQPNTPSTTSGSSNSTSQSKTPPTTSGSGSSSATTADPSSFTVSIEAFTPSAPAGQTSVRSQTITLTNGSQSGIMNWSVSISTDDGGDWLSFSPDSGTLQPNQSKDYQITVTVSKDMPAQQYNGTVQFSPNSANSPNKVSVSLTVVAAPSGPSVSGISPASGPAAGGTSVTITGAGFTGATGVSFGPTAASSFTVDSDTQITAVSPAGSGTVDVTVTTQNGTSAIGVADQFTYT